ncbi:MAG: response regulator transcription factor [Flavobacteriaceae bacterium]
MDKISIAITENNKLIANLLKDYLNKIEDFSVINLSYSGNSFLNFIDTGDIPDVLILDLRMEDGDGKHVINSLIERNIETNIIVLSSYYNPNYLGYMFKIGISAFIPKEISQENLIEIIRTVYRTGYYFDNEQILVLRKQIHSKNSDIPTKEKDLLTSRELDVLKLLCQQLTAKAIADKLFISKKTVETHKSNLLSKTGAKNIAGLVIFASQNNLIDLNEIPL